MEQTIDRDIDFLKKRGRSIQPEKHTYGWAYRLLEEPRNAFKLERLTEMTTATTKEWQQDFGIKCRANPAIFNVEKHHG